MAMRNTFALTLLAGRDNVRRITFQVSHTAGFTITPSVARWVGCPYAATWDWGDGSPLETGDAPSHAYAAAGTYRVTLHLPHAERWLQQFHAWGAHVVGAELWPQLARCRRLQALVLHTNAGLTGNLAGYSPAARWPELVYLNLVSTAVGGDIGSWVFPAGLATVYLYDTNVTGDVAGWVLPVGMHELNISWTNVSGDITDWILPATLTHLTVNNTLLEGDPSGWALPAGLAYLHLGGAGFAGDIGGWAFPTTMTHFYASGAALSGVPDCRAALGLVAYERGAAGLDTATVDAILRNLYELSATPRTATDGVIELRDNAAPSGAFQAAASCPVSALTPGKEIAHELLHDGCGAGFNTWASVQVTA